MYYSSLHYDDSPRDYSPYLLLLLRLLLLYLLILFLVEGKRRATQWTCLLSKPTRKMKTRFPGNGDAVERGGDRSRHSHKDRETTPTCRNMSRKTVDCYYCYFRCRLLLLLPLRAMRSRARHSRESPILRTAPRDQASEPKKKTMVG